MHYKVHQHGLQVIPGIARRRWKAAR